MEDLKGFWPLVGGIFLFVLLGFIYILVLYFNHQLCYSLMLLEGDWSERRRHQRDELEPKDPAEEEEAKAKPRGKRPAVVEINIAN